MSEVWVTNASPVIVLAKAGYLKLLKDLPSELLLPEPVAAEIVAGPKPDLYLLQDPASKLSPREEVSVVRYMVGQVDWKNAAQRTTDHTDGTDKEIKKP